MKWLIVLTMLALGSHALAQDKIAGSYDTDKPIEITADSLEVLQQQKQAIFTGRVLAKQGNVNLKADKMIVHYSQGSQKSSEAASPVGGSNAISRIEVEGNVLLATPAESAKGSRGVYDVSKKEIRLIGDVVLTREKNVLNGSNLVYNLATGKSLLTGGVAAGTQENGGRVRGLFIPKSTE